MGLKETFSAVFIKLTPETERSLRLIHDYVVFGEPTVKTISDLIYKRGFAHTIGKDDKEERVQLSDNLIVERALGEFGLIALEDLINELYNVGPHFDKVCRFLYPFRLSSPPKELQKKRKKLGDDPEKQLSKDVNELVMRLV